MSPNLGESPSDSSSHGVSLDKPMAPAARYFPLSLPTHGEDLSKTDMLNEVIYSTRSRSYESQGWSATADSNDSNIYEHIGINNSQKSSHSSTEKSSSISDAINAAPIVFLPNVGASSDSHLPSHIPIDLPAQYGSIGQNIEHSMHELGILSRGTSTNLSGNTILANMDMPWSAFICGSQGAGKSHTLSCLLENGLLQNHRINHLPNPLAALVFHYDHFTSRSCSQVCEAAYLCSSGLPVTVLVSPSNIWAMSDLYSNLPGLSPDCPRPRVLPLYLSETSLDITTMLKLMAVDPTSDHIPLYMETVMSILREMAMEGKGAGAFSYAEFRARLEEVGWIPGQRVPLDLRLQLLDSFLEPSKFTKSTRPAPATESLWSFKPGTLTIIDLSDPFVSSNDACSLFSICLSLFLEDRNQSGRVVALDEAHKFLLQSGAARVLTADLTSIIRQQRHTGTRVYIATQEPTLSPDLIDLCNATFVHRFLSPAWYETLKKHLAGVSKSEGKKGKHSLFEDIVALETGEALLFCPTAMVLTNEDQAQAGEYDKGLRYHISKLSNHCARIRIRHRVTYDGGRSILATDTTIDLAPSRIQCEIPMHIVEKKKPSKSSGESKEKKRTTTKDNGTYAPNMHRSNKPVVVRKATQLPIANLNISSQDGLNTAAYDNTSNNLTKRNISDADIERMTRREMRRHFEEFKWHSVSDVMWRRFIMVIEFGFGQEPGSFNEQPRYRNFIKTIALDEHKKCRNRKAQAKTKVIAS